MTLPPAQGDLAPENTLLIASDRNHNCDFLVAGNGADCRSRSASHDTSAESDNRYLARIYPGIAGRFHGVCQSKLADCKIRLLS